MRKRGGGGPQSEQGDTYPLARKGHLWVGGNGQLGKSLGGLGLPNISAFQSQGEQSLSNDPSPVSTQAGPGSTRSKPSILTALSPSPPTLSLGLRILPAQTPLPSLRSLTETTQTFLNQPLGANHGLCRALGPQREKEASSGSLWVQRTPRSLSTEASHSTGKSSCWPLLVSPRASSH